MARIYETPEGMYYQTDEIEIPLNDDTYMAFQHRHTGFQLLDWVGVKDPRDNEYFSHFRYDQPQEPFENMLQLAKRLGTYVLTDTPYDHIQAMFNVNHSITEDDLTHLLEES